MELEDWYAIPPLRLWFTFNPETNSINSFTVRYDKEDAVAKDESTAESLKTTPGNKTPAKKLRLVRNYG
jgi:hypothetical protein